MTTAKVVLRASSWTVSSHHRAHVFALRSSVDAGTAGNRSDRRRRSSVAFGACKLPFQSGKCVNEFARFEYAIAVTGLHRS